MCFLNVCNKKNSQNFKSVTSFESLSIKSLQGSRVVYFTMLAPFRVICKVLASNPLSWLNRESERLCMEDFMCMNYHYTHEDFVCSYLDLWPSHHVGLRWRARMAFGGCLVLYNGRGSQQFKELMPIFWLVCLLHHCPQCQCLDFFDGNVVWGLSIGVHNGCYEEFVYAITWISEYIKRKVIRTTTCNRRHQVVHHQHVHFHIQLQPYT